MRSRAQRESGRCPGPKIQGLGNVSSRPRMGSGAAHRVDSARGRGSDREGRTGDGHEGTHLGNQDALDDDPCIPKLEELSKNRSPSGGQGKRKRQRPRQEGAEDAAAVEQRGGSRQATPVVKMKVGEKKRRRSLTPLRRRPGVALKSKGGEKSENEEDVGEDAPLGPAPEPEVVEDLSDVAAESLPNVGKLGFDVADCVADWNEQVRKVFKMSPTFGDLGRHLLALAGTMPTARSPPLRLESLCHMAISCRSLALMPETWIG